MFQNKKCIVCKWGSHPVATEDRFKCNHCTLSNFEPWNNVFTQCKNCIHYHEHKDKDPNCECNKCIPLKFELDLNCGAPRCSE
jgi:hypothetical protein